MLRAALFAICVLCAGLAGFFAFLASAADAPPDAAEIVNSVDRLYRSETSRGKLEMTVVTENWERTLRMDFSSEGLEKTFVRITYPKKEEGIATLRIGNEMWNYFPGIDRVMKVPPSMMMASWMGSDFTNDDLVKESSMLRDYTYRLMEPEVTEGDIYRVELLPREDLPIVWGRIILSVRREGFIPVREEYFDEAGRRMRVMEFRDVRNFGGRNIPAVIELTPLTVEGRKTVIRYLDIAFDAALEKDTFTLRNLQRRR